jgi:hypothetical protein
MRNRALTPWLLATAFLLGAPPLLAVTYFVDRFDDQASASDCSPFIAGDCSLRGAVLHANSTALADTILLPGGVYQLTLAGALEDQAQTGDLDVLEDLTISAAMGGTPAIVQTTADRVFHLLGATASLSVVGPMTLQGGFGVDAGGNGDGGSLLADRGVALTITNVIIEGASAEEQGGCLHSRLNDPGDSVTLTDVVIQGCSAESGGGAFISVGDAQVLLERVRIESCQASKLGGGLSLIGGPSLAIVSPGRRRGRERHGLRAVHAAVEPAAKPSAKRKRFHSRMKKVDGQKRAEAVDAEAVAVDGPPGSQRGRRRRGCAHSSARSTAAAGLIAGSDGGSAGGDP